MRCILTIEPLTIPSKLKRLTETAIAPKASLSSTASSMKTAGENVVNELMTLGKPIFDALLLSAIEEAKMENQ